MSKNRFWFSTAKIQSICAHLQLCDSQNSVPQKTSQLFLVLRITSVKFCGNPRNLRDKTMPTDKKCTDNRLIISAFLLISGNWVPVQSGAGGSRTPVQTRRKDAFYKLSLRLIVGAGMVRDTPGRRLSSKISPQPRSAASAISPFMILRSGR